MRAVIYLSMHHHQRVGGDCIAKALGTPKAFTVKVLQELAKDDIIQSNKGPNGGFSITNHQKKQPVIKIVEVIDGLDYFFSCGIGLSECSDKKPCPFHEVFKKARNEIFDTFNNSLIGSFTPENLEKTFFINDQSRQH